MENERSPGSKITDITVLQRDLVWALLKYSDGSEFCFLTTLSPKILSDYGVTLEEGNLVRLDKQYYIDGKFVYKQFAFAGTKISLWSKLTYTHEPSYRMHDFL